MRRLVLYLLSPVIPIPLHSLCRSSVTSGGVRVGLSEAEHPKNVGHRWTEVALLHILDTFCSAEISWFPTHKCHTYGEGRYTMPSTVGWVRARDL